MNSRRRQRLRVSSCRLCVAVDRELSTDVTAGVVTVADAFPLVPGHALLVATTHTGGFGHGWSVEGLAALRDAVEGPTRTPYLLVEHGVLADQPRTHCIDHAHIHLFPEVPVMVDQLLETPAFAFAGRARLDRVALHEVPTALDAAEYVWIADSRGASVLVQPTDAVPAQLARRAMAEALGLSTWDWRRQLALDQAARIRRRRGPEA